MSVLLGIDMDFANPCKQWGGVLTFSSTNAVTVPSHGFQ